MQDVTAAIITRDHQVLIAQRAKNQSYAAYWEFPGGKVEEGETPEHCLKRELFEEFGVEANIKKFIHESIYEYPKGAIRLLAYQVDLISETIELRVHDAYRWVDIDDLPNYDLLPADIPIIEKLAEEL